MAGVQNMTTGWKLTALIFILLDGVRKLDTLLNTLTVPILETVPIRLIFSALSKDSQCSSAE